MENQENGKNLLDDSVENLSEEIADEEKELIPPDEEKETEVNVGKITGFIFVGIIVIILFITILGSSKGKKKVKNDELDKAGSKIEVGFDGFEQKKTPEKNAPKEETTEKVTDEKVDELLENVDKKLESGTSPVLTNSGNLSKVSDRPDTKNSKSPRKIDGIAGQNYAATDNLNGNIVSSVLNGNYGSRSSFSGMSKEDYINQQMKNVQSVQNQLYGQSSKNQAAAYQTERERFYNQAENTGGNGQYMSYNSLWDGTVISGALMTAINTDNPGVVIARVTQNVYSSYDHSVLLIPEGSLLYATYNSSVSYGQNKVQVAWNLLIRPDGYRITLGNMNGVNAQGASGYKGSVSNHPWETLKALGMIAIYSMIQTEASKSINSQNNDYVKNAMSDVYTQTTTLGNKIIDRALDIKPTIKIKSGTEIKLITNIPLELPPCKINPANQKYVRTR